MKIASVLGPSFEDSEFKDPYDAFRGAGHEVVIVGLEAGTKLDGSKGKASATVEKAFQDVKPDDFDALFIPGGSSPDKLRALTDAMHTDGRPAFLEVVSTTRDDELRSIETGLAIGVDYLLGGTHVDAEDGEIEMIQPVALRERARQLVGCERAAFKQDPLGRRARVARGLDGLFDLLRGDEAQVDDHVGEEARG